MPLVEEMIDNGFNVTIFTIHTKPIKDPNKENLKIITSVINSDSEIEFPDPEFVKKVTSKIWSIEFNSYIMGVWMKQKTSIIDLSFKHDKELINRIVNSKWDYVMVDEIITFIGNIIAQKLFQERNIRFGIVATSKDWDYQSRERGMGNTFMGQPLFYGNNMLLTKEHNFFDFSWSLNVVWEKLSHLYYVQWRYERYIKKCVEKLNFLSMEYSQRWIFRNGDFVIKEYPDKIFYPTTVAVDNIENGNICLKKKEKPLENDLKKLFDSPETKEVVYLAFGTAITFYDAPPHILKGFRELFNYHKNVTFVWSYKGPEILNLPPNVNIFDWVPQIEVLRHKKTKIFLTHSGLKSFKEGLCNEVPMIFLPITAEQHHNSLVAKNYLDLPFVNKFYLKGSDLIEYVDELLVNYDNYKNKLVKAKKFMEDRIIPSLKESTIKLKQFITKPQITRFTRRKGTDQGWLEYLYMKEIILVFTTFFLLALK
uniref:glucuronosyltransferase n=1 Tax=Strongyloides papillosus TaxID=174720 RepID=A0A0N5BF78_STREA